MKIHLMIARKWLVSTVIAAGFLTLPAASAVAQSPDPANEPASGSPVCLPAAYPTGADSCLALGPSAYLTGLAQQGLSYPLRALPASKPSAELSISPVQVARINIDQNLPADIYATLDDAAAGNNPVRSIAPGETRYVSYITEARVNGKPFVQLKSGEWMRASPAGISYFQGLLFRQTPTNDFGWIVDTNRARSGPGYANPEVGDELYRETVVQIFEIVPADGVDWYRIDIDRWVERRYVRQVRVNTTPPEGVAGDRWIEVNLYDQTLSVYDHRQLVFATMVATGGEPLFTQPGLFQVYKKLELETMQGATRADRSDYYFLEDVPWTMYFDQARALHGAYWRAGFGYPGTHGCVNLSIGDSKWLFDWANEGEPVYVWDPSGETPTDPAFYGAGGA